MSQAGRVLLQMANIEPLAFRNALGSFATGVTVVTAAGPDGRDVGVTANSFNSVSLDPPLILWSLNRSSGSLKAFTESEGFAVHILAADQQAVSDRFASRKENRFENLDFERGVGGAPLLPGCTAQFQCRLAFRYDGGDHEILVGEVVALDHSPKPPLIYHGGRYGGVSGLVPKVPAEDSSGAERELMHLLSRAYHQLFAVEREAFKSRGLTEDAYLVLRLLGTKDGQTASSLAATMATADRSLAAEIVENLLERGEILLSGDAFSLTQTGRQTLLEMTAIRFDLEEEAVKRLDRTDVLLLKDLLRRLFKAGTHKSAGGLK